MFNLMQPQHNVIHNTCDLLCCTNAMQACSHAPADVEAVPVAVPDAARYTVPAAADTTCGMTLLAAFHVSGGQSLKLTAQRHENASIQGVFDFVAAKHYDSA
jgi:hypothetical protein